MFFAKSGNSVTLPPSFITQNLASNPSHSAWVSANAGTGKTKVLTDRVLRLLLSGAKPGAILCLTFTKAAAAEMRERIHRQLGVWATASDERLIADITALTGASPESSLLPQARRLFAEILDLPGGLSIQTLHAFCQSLMQRFPLEAGILPGFELMDDLQTAALLREVRGRLLHQTAEDATYRPDVAQALDALSWRVSEHGMSGFLQEMIGQRDKIARLLQTHAGREGAMKALCQALALPYPTPLDDQNDTLLHAFISDLPREKLLRIHAAMEQGSAANKTLAEILARWLSAPDAEKIRTFDEYERLFLTQQKEPKKLQNVLTQKGQESEPNAADWILTEQERLLRLSRHQTALMLYHSTGYMLIIAEALLKAYDALKHARGLLDYSDLIRASVRLLSQESIAPWVLYKLDNSIDHLLVDEAQDTSPEQWELVDILTREFFVGASARDIERTLFVVGDEKQSIYRFQGADPKVFSQMHDLLSNRANEAAKGWHSLVLDRSFRSTEAVLNIVDEVFKEEALHRAVTSSSEPISHAVHRTGQPGRVELWPLVPHPSHEEKDKDEDSSWPLPLAQTGLFSPHTVLAEHIAKTIRSWLDEGRMLETKARAITPGDIMILVRKRGVLMGLLVGALKKHGIPVAGIDRVALHDSLAVMDVLALSSFLLLPQDDLTLATVLKSPLVGLDEKALFDLSYDRGKTSLWERLQSHKITPPYTHAHQYLSDLLREADALSPCALLSHILYRKGGKKALTARLGYDIHEPLEELLNLALEYEQTHTASLQGFLAWIAHHRSDIKRDSEQGRNAVRVLTVHGAKGLQAPIVFLPDTTSPPSNGAGNKSPILWNANPPLALWAANSKEHTELYKELKDAVKHADEEESLRLLYVALTRAEDRLYVGGLAPYKNLHECSWYKLLEKALTAQGAQAPSDGIAFAWQEESSCAAYGTALGTTRAETVIATPQEIVLPKHFLHPAMPDSIAELLTPSHATKAPLSSPLDSTTSRAITHGTLTHILLQYLPGISLTQREQAGKNYLHREGANLSDSEQQNILRTALKILEHPDYAFLFGTNSRAETPIVGKVRAHPYSGQVDRLVIEPARVVIIDYKTGIAPSSSGQAPTSYLRQMAIYQAIVAQIYPEKPVKCALLWTSAPMLMWLEDSLLTSHLPEDRHTPACERKQKPEQLALEWGS